MSRDIKFRAWDKHNKVMYDRVLAGCNQDNSSYICNRVWMESKKDWVHFDEACGSIMQYTGLKDKNGREIYEGDILTSDLERPYLVVEFRNGCFVVECFDDGKKYYDIMTPVYIDTSFTKYHEVIGNIHDNPEFLEGGVSDD